jgi:chemotaxis protein methyltransferase CheR
VEPITKQEFARLKTIMDERFGIEIKDGKITLVESRLSKTLAERGMSRLGQYLDAVMRDRTGALEQELAQKLTTNHTYFMREPEHFRFFQETVLPWLVGTVRDGDLRTWSAGCSSGEEPYTLAMCMADFFNLRSESWNTKILATDISAAVLERAVEAIYPVESLQNIPDRWKKLYFESLDSERVRVGAKIREEVIFRHLNLIEQVFPFKRKFHLILCRNVMIYFDTPMKNRLIKKFYDATEPGGYLFIGHSESLGRDTCGYKYIKPSIYRKE